MIALPFIHSIEPRSLDFEIITLEQLQSMLQTSKGAKIITLVTVTEPNLVKMIKDVYNPYLSCVKVSRVNGIVNFEYKNSVNTLLKKEGKEPDFIPQPRRWGTRLNNSPFVSHVTNEGQNKLYLEVRIKNYLGECYYNPITGLLIDYKDIEPWLKRKPEEKIILRDYTVSNIATIVIDKQGFLIKENIL